MKRLPDAELTLMMLIWDSEGPVSRAELEERMDRKGKVTPSTTLTLLSRLEDRGFVSKTRQGKINYYAPLVEKEPYLKETSRNILEKLFGGSLSNFAATLYAGEELSQQDIAELQQFLDEKTKPE